MAVLEVRSHQRPNGMPVGWFSYQINLAPGCIHYCCEEDIWAEPDHVHRYFSEKMSLIPGTPDVME